MFDCPPAIRARRERERTLDTFDCYHGSIHAGEPLATSVSHPHLIGHVTSPPCRVLTTGRSSWRPGARQRLTSRDRAARPVRLVRESGLRVEAPSVRSAVLR